MRYNLEDKAPWQKTGFFDGLEGYNAAYTVLDYPCETDVCPNCGANVNVENHEPLEIGREVQYMKVSSECQLGCGHKVWIA